MELDSTAGAACQLMMAMVVGARIMCVSTETEGQGNEGERKKASKHSFLSLNIVKECGDQGNDRSFDA